MPHTISDNCVSCGTCADLCPEGAVSEGKSTYVVDADKCKDCGDCEETCDEGAIKGDAKAKSA